MTVPVRVTLSQRTSNALKQVAAKTGLTPNIVARIALLVSLENRQTPSPDLGEPDLTINRGSLFGDLEPFLAAAYRVANDRESDGGTGQWPAHIARGAFYLRQKVNSLAELTELLVR